MSCLSPCVGHSLGPQYYFLSSLILPLEIKTRYYHQQYKYMLTTDCQNIATFVLLSLDSFQWLFSSLHLFSYFYLLEVPQKPTVSLNPPWNRIFKGENVTLTCNGSNFFEVSSMKWFHNGSLSEVANSSLNIVNADFEDSGEYKCQHQQFDDSEPVHLEVFSGKFQGYGNTDLSCECWPIWRQKKTGYSES